MLPHGCTEVGVEMKVDWQFLTCRPGVACSVTGVGETIMRAGLARAVTTQMQASTALAVDSICEATIRENILDGQPAALPCPHKDCGILAIRVNASGASTFKTLSGSSTSCCCSGLLADCCVASKSRVFRAALHARICMLGPMSISFMQRYVHSCPWTEHLNG